MSLPSSSVAHYRPRVSRWSIIRIERGGLGKQWRFGAGAVTLAGKCAEEDTKNAWGISRGA
jgi:hypothetical protein